MMKITLVSSNELCECVGKHIPKPTRLYKVDYSGGYIFLCPTALDNLRSLEIEFLSIYGEELPGSIKKHYSKFIQDVYDLVTS